MTGALHIVGLGPGGPAHRTPAAAEAVAGAQVVVGYGQYVDQCADLLGPEHEVVRGRMGEEGARADEALDRAAAGARVALVSSGDAGIYGMASRTLARAAALPADDRPAVTVVPGMTAALAAAALLGAPLADDHATLSLSDLHLPWEQVERRLVACASAGLALALYNPRSKQRTWQLDRVLGLLREHRGDTTPIAAITDAARPDQDVHVTTLAQLEPERVGMRTLLIVAGETTVQAGPWLVANRSAEQRGLTPLFPLGAETRADRGGTAQ